MISSFSHKFVLRGRVLIVFTALILLLGLAGCGSEAPTPTPTPTKTAAPLVTPTDAAIAQANATTNAGATQTAAVTFTPTATDTPTTAPTAVVTDTVAPATDTPVPLTPTPAPVVVQPTATPRPVVVQATPVPAPVQVQPTNTPVPVAPTNTPAPPPASGDAAECAAIGGDGCKFKLRGGPVTIANGGGELKLTLAFVHSGIGNQAQGSYFIWLEKDGVGKLPVPDSVRSWTGEKRTGPSGFYNYEHKMGLSDVGGSVAGCYTIWVLDGNGQRDSLNSRFCVPEGQGEVWMLFDQA